MRNNEDAGRAAPPPRFCDGNTIFDLLVSGGLWALLCWRCLAYGPLADGSYVFLRRTTAGGGVVRLGLLAGGLCFALGCFLLVRRLFLARRVARLRPKKNLIKKERYSVRRELASALKEMFGLSGGVARAAEQAKKRPAPPRSLGRLLSHPKTRTSLSCALLFLLCFVAPKQLLLDMGPHVMVFMILQFAMFMLTIIVLLVAWVELGE